MVTGEKPYVAVVSLKQYGLQASKAAKAAAAAAANISICSADTISQAD